MEESASVSPERHFELALERYMDQTQRQSQTSSLFDLPRRSTVGGVCFFENLADLLGRLDCSPEEIGRQMRRLGSRPYLMHVSALMFGYRIGEKEYEATVGGSRDDRREDKAAIVEFWRRVLEAYRADGWDFSTGRQIVVEEDELDRIIVGMQGGEGRHAWAREFGLLQNLNFLLHGESRDGLFDHGPYHCDDGVWVCKELTDLRGGSIRGV